MIGRKRNTKYICSGNRILLLRGRTEERGNEFTVKQDEAVHFVRKCQLDEL